MKLQKTIFFLFMLIMSVQTNAQIINHLLGQGDKPKNDKEVMEKSKAKEPLLRMLDKLNSANSYKRDYYSACKRNQGNYEYDDKGFEEEKKYLVSWAKSAGEGAQAMEEAKTLDPKFKWNKLKKNYDEELKTLETELEKENTDYTRRLKYCQRLSYMDRTCRYLLSRAKGLKDASIYGEIKNFDLKNFRDTVNIAKADDPEMKILSGLKKSDAFFQKEIPNFLTTELPNVLNWFIKDIENHLGSLKLEEIQAKLAGSDTTVAGLNFWFASEKSFVEIKSNYYKQRDNILKEKNDYIEREKKQKVEDLEAAYLPKAVINDPALVSETMACIKATLDPSFTLLKVIPHNEWRYERHKYTNQITSRWTTVMVVAKNPNGKCYTEELNVFKYVGPGGGYKKVDCENFSGFFGTAEKPAGQEIKCERVK